MTSRVPALTLILLVATWLSDGSATVAVTSARQVESFHGDSQDAFDELVLQLRSGLLLFMPTASVERFIGARGLTLSVRWPDAGAPTGSRWARNDAAGLVTLELERPASGSRSATVRFVPTTERGVPESLLAHLLSKGNSRVDSADAMELRFDDELALNQEKCSSTMTLRIRLTSGSLMEHKLTVCFSQD